jgi:hypothetical protein
MKDLGDLTTTVTWDEEDECFIARAGAEEYREFRGRGETQLEALEDLFRIIKKSENDEHE